MLKPQLLRNGLIALVYILIGPSVAHATHKIVIELINNISPPEVQSPQSIGISSIDAIAASFNAVGILPVLPNAAAVQSDWPRLSRMYCVLLPDSADTTNALAAYRTDTNVFQAFCDSDTMDFYSTIPTDEFFHYQWHLDNTGQQAGTDTLLLTDIDAPEAWDFTEGESSMLIGILDSGIIRSHPDIAGQLWVNEDELLGDEDDNDDNGYVNDKYGWDFSDNDGDPEPLESTTLAGHGLSTAGVIIAKRSDTSPGGGVVGVANGCKLICTRISNIDNPNEPGAGAKIGAAMVYVVENGARIVSMSVGADPQNPALPGIMAALDDIAGSHPDVLLVMAAGNGQLTPEFRTCRFEGAFMFRGISPENRSVLASIRMPIANICYSGVRVPSSSYLPASSERQTISVGAPGGGAVGPCEPDTSCLQTSSHFTVCHDSLDANGDRVLGWAGNFGGTSTAAPMVAGIAGLVRSDDPDLSAAQTKVIIEKSAIDVVTDVNGGSVPGYDIYTGYGVANAHRALLYPWVKLPNVAGLSYWAGDTLHVRWRKPKHNSILCKSKIEYSTTNGANWNTIVDGLADSDTVGFYVWTIPTSLSTTSAKIRVTNYHPDATNPRNVISDESDNPFSISTWSGTVVLNSDYTVPAGQTLTILPGTQVLFGSSDASASGFDASRVELIVEGTLVADGQTTSRINFSTVAAPAHGIWYGVRVRSGGTAHITYADVEGVLYGVRAHPGAGNLWINYCTFKHFESAAVYASGTSDVPGCRLTFLNSDITFTSNAPYGIYCYWNLKSAQIQGVDIATEGTISPLPSGHGIHWDATVTETPYVPSINLCSVSGLTAGDGFHINSGSPVLRGIAAQSCKWGARVLNSGTPTIATTISGTPTPSSVTECTIGLYAADSCSVVVDKAEVLDSTTGIYTDGRSTGEYTRLFIHSSSPNTPQVATGFKSYSTAAHSLRGSTIEDYSAYAVYASQNSILNVGTELLPGHNYIHLTGSATPQKHIGAKSPRMEGLSNIQALFNCFYPDTTSLFGSLVDHGFPDCDHIGELSRPVAVASILSPAELRVRPNPSSGDVEIAFSGVSRPGAELPTAQIYDVAGRLISEVTLRSAGVDGMAVGVWDGKEARTRASRAGIYFVRVKAEGVVRTAKIHRLK